MLHFIPFSKRTILIHIKYKQNIINLIRVYAPTADKENDGIEQFYSSLEKVVKTTKNRHITIVMSDFNAKIGQGKVGEHVENYGLGNWNWRGDRLINLPVITNTFLLLPAQRLYSWASIQHTNEKIVRNQIYLEIRPV